MKVVSIRFRDFECLLCGVVSPTRREAAEHQERTHGDALRYTRLPGFVRWFVFHLSMVVWSSRPMLVAGRIFNKIVEPPKVRVRNEMHWEDASWNPWRKP